MASTHPVVRSAMSTPAAWAEVILAATDAKGRAGLLTVNRAWYAMLAQADSYVWRVLAQATARDAMLYQAPRMFGMSARDVFSTVWNDRNTWRDGTEEEGADDAQRAGEAFNIRVYARFRPADEARVRAGHQKDVVLPLHQRLETIRKMNNMKTNSEAGHLLFKDRNVNADQWCVVGKGEKPHPTDDRKPAVGAAAGGAAAVSVLDVDRAGTVLTIAPGAGMRAFDFNAAFGGDALQEDVYEAAGTPVVQDFINGNDACCLVFGQTGSGKTFTMYGADGGAAPGVVPRAGREIFAALAQREHTFASELKLSYVELFGESLSDLLNDGEAVAPNRAAAQRWVLEGNVQHDVGSLEELERLLAIGDGEKRRAATLMNERSSRAHSLCILTLKQTAYATGVSHESTLVLADLGGSEDIKKSGAGDNVVAAGAKRMYNEMTGEEESKMDWNEYYFKRERLQEAININKGLLALKTCIRKLHQRQAGERVHIPYQDNKLTHLLSGVLGGKARTSIVVCGSPSAMDAVETLNTLRFGEACRAIVTTGSKADASARAVAVLVADLDKQIAAAEAAYKASEKWVREKVTKKREKFEESAALDERAGIMHAQHHVDEEEMRDVYRMVGGDAERELLEKLLDKRRSLVGM